MSHTPGPWELGHLGPHGSFEIGVGYLRPGILSHDGFVIAGRAAIQHKADEMCANARLIAAAPEMLDALKLAERWLANCVPTVALDVPKPLPVIAAAIAKAQGC